MKTIIINPNSNIAKGVNKATVEPPIGIGYLASFLNSKGYGCSIVDANILNLNEEAVLKRIDTDTKIIGISFNVVSAIAAFNLLRYLKPNFPKAIFIAGGPHPSAIPDICLKNFDFDAICIGEGEETLLEIVRNVEQDKAAPFDGVDGVYYKKNGQIIKNPPRKLIERLDELPFVDFGIFPSLSLYKSRARAKPVGVILASRGCPYQCIYCNKNIFQARHRVRSVGNIIREIKEQILKFGVKQIDFLDDNLTLDIAFANSLFQEIINNNFNLHINLQNGVRADLLNEDLVRKMKQAGVFKVSIGVESGDARVQKIIKKNVDLNKVLEATRLFRKYGIKVYGNFMFGLPNDNKESMQKTIDFAIKMNPDIANFMITIPLPGTELYEIIKDKGVFLENLELGISQGFYGGKTYYQLGDMDIELVREFYQKSYKKFYFRPKKMIQIAGGINSLHELKWISDAVIEISKSIFGVRGGSK